MPVGFLPEQFEVSSGLATDFEGVVIDAQVEIWNYEGKAADRTAVNVKIMPRAGTDIPLQNQHYSASKPEIHMPSLDGRPGSASPAGGPHFAYMGPLTLNKVTGAYDVEKGLPGNSNWEHFLECAVGCLQAAGAPLDRMATGNVKVALRGIKGYWTRIPQKDRKIKDDKHQSDKKNDILVLARFDGYATEEEIAQLTALANAGAGSAATPGQMPVSGQVAGGPIGYNPAAAAYNPAAAPTGYPMTAPAPAPAGFAPYVPPAAPAAAPAPAPAVGGFTAENMAVLSGLITEKLRSSGGTVARATLAITLVSDPRAAVVDRGALLSAIGQDAFWAGSAAWMYDPATQNVTLRA